MRKPLLCATVLLSCLAVPALAQLPPECGTTLPLAAPYVFILFDVSGSQNHAAACTQAEYDAGQCAYVCTGTQCHTRGSSIQTTVTIWRCLNSGCTSTSLTGTQTVAITDNTDECPAFDPCADIAALRLQSGLETSILALGMSYNLQINCIAQNGHGMQYYPKTRQQIEDSLNDFFTNVVGVQP